jgi:hypothetical protein
MLVKLAWINIYKTDQMLQVQHKKRREGKKGRKENREE